MSLTAEFIQPDEVGSSAKIEYSLVFNIRHHQIKMVVLSSHWSWWSLRHGGLANADSDLKMRIAMLQSPVTKTRLGCRQYLMPIRQNGHGKSEREKRLAAR